MLLPFFVHLFLCKDVEGLWVWLYKASTKLCSSRDFLPNSSGGRSLLAATVSKFLDASVRIFGLPETCLLRAILSFPTNSPLLPCH